MSETILLSLSVFFAVGFTAWLMLTVQKRSQEPLLKEMRYMIRHVAAHDLQVYHGISMTDFQTDPQRRRTPAAKNSRSPEDLMVEAEALAMEFDRMNGNLAPSAET